MASFNNYAPSNPEGGYDPRTLVELINKMCVQTVESGGRNFTFAHKYMADVTQRSNKRNHKFKSLDSLIAFTKKKATPNQSLIFVSDSALTLILDGDWMENISVYLFEASKASTRWINKRYTQQEFIDLLDTWQGDLEYLGKPSTKDIGSLLASFMNLSIATSISYEAKFEDPNNLKIGFQIQDSDKSGIATLPKVWGLKIPIFEGGDPVVVDCRLRIKLPKNHDEHPQFWLECPRMEALKEAAIKTTVDIVAKNLNEFLVLFGDCGVSYP